jgi:NAD(P)-dependent dehydrogenase (short-subunit alcohol dehydrogenase family)
MTKQHAQQSGDSPHTAVIVGASGGLGRALTDALTERAGVDRVFALSRRYFAPKHPQLTWLEVDASDPRSLERAAGTVADAVPAVHLLIICTGILHGGEEHDRLQPEKSLGDLDGENFRRVMSINALAPLQVIHAFAPLLRHEDRTVVAALSAMVGSIGDNRIGGWYSYRMSKAALNMGLHNAAIELGRLRPRGRPKPIVAAVHPGTTETPLSEPFLRNHSSRPAAESAGHILSVLDSLTEDDSGGFFNWDGKPLPW